MNLNDLNLKKIQISVRYFDEICRTCSNRGDLISIFDESNFKTTIVDMIKAVTSVHISPNDNLPNQICKVCIKRLEFCYDFIKQCEKFDKTFRSFVNSGYKPLLVENVTVNKEVKNSTNTNLTPNQELKIGEFKLEVFKGNEHFCESSQDGQENFANTDVNEIYVCQSCGIMADEYDVFTEHLNLHCKEIKNKEKPKNSSLQELENSLQNVENVDYSAAILDDNLFCRICNREFDNAQGLRIHKAFHKSHDSESQKFFCNLCSKSFYTSKGLRNHYKYHTNKLYECKFCNKRFTAKTRLELHLRTHTGEKPFLCNDCGKCFTSKTSLKVHELTHTGARPHCCKTCGRRFKQHSHLKNHQLMHSGVKSFVCACGKAFAFKGNLTVHMRTHSGEKPYVCPVCNRGFCDSPGMKRHRKTHF